tara:strand:- start:238 stop:504 length:267 start_codon:yes stop_codon:yes gene_type:complete
MNKLIKKSIIKLITNIAEEESLNIEYSIERAIELLNIELKQEQKLQKNLERLWKIYFDHKDNDTCEESKIWAKGAMREINKLTRPKTK